MDSFQGCCEPFFWALAFFATLEPGRDRQVTMLAAENFEESFLEILSRSGARVNLVGVLIGFICALDDSSPHGHSCPECLSPQLTAVLPQFGHYRGLASQALGLAI